MAKIKTAKGPPETPLNVTTRQIDRHQNLREMRMGKEKAKNHAPEIRHEEVALQSILKNTGN